MKALTLIFCAAIAAPAWSLDFDANGKRLDPEPDRQREYQWKDPRTGQTITKPYPPANLKMRQTGRSADGWVTYLEVEGKAKFEDAVNLNTPQSVSNASSNDVVQNCFESVRQGLKDPYSAKLESSIPIPGVTTVSGAVRQTVTIYVNAKNSYGGYTGTKPYTCTLKMDNLTVQ